MRPVVRSLAALLATMAAASAQADGATLIRLAQAAPTPLVPAPQAAAQPTPAQGTRRVTIVGDEGVICATARQAPVDALANVVKACSKIQAKQPTTTDRARVLRYRGIALQRTGDMAGAIPDFDQVLRLTPDDTMALKGRAEAHEALGNRAPARADYARLEQLTPDTRWRIKLAELGAPAPNVTAQAAPPPQAPEPPAVVPPKPPVAEAPAAPAADDPAVLTRKLQTALRALGYDVGAVNGLAGTKTRRAMGAFATDVGLQPGAEPERALLAAAEDELGQRREVAAAEQVKRNRRVQQGLADLGYYKGDIDGALGSRSRDALERWLADTSRPAGMPVDDTLAQALDAAVLANLSRERPDAGKAQAAVEPAPATGQPPQGVSGNLASALDALSSPSEPFTPPPEVAPQPVSPGASVAVPGSPPAGPPPQAVASQSARPYEILPPGSEPPEKRVALVIGNGQYQSVTKLANPMNDAADVSAALAELGFEVLKGVDLSRENMTRITKDFARRARTADIAMAYYSGHGMQFDGTNYLVPVDVQLQDEYDVRDMIELSHVIRDTGQARKLSMVVVDACRDDPLAVQALTQGLGGSRSLNFSQSLNTPQLPPSPSLIAYATAGGTVAYDGKEQTRNSPFTAALLKNIKTPKLDVVKLFGKVADEVRLATRNAQRPDKWDNLGGDPIYLVPGPPDPVGLELAQFTSSEVQLVQRSLKWLKYWSGAEDGGTSAELTLALRSWQRSTFVDDTGRLTPQQLIGLHRVAVRERPREPLPEAKLGQGGVEGNRFMGMMFDPAFADGPFPKDRSGAQNWYTQAAAQGDRTSARLLGEMLVASDNPLPNRQDAMKWLDMAAQAGDADAALRIAELMLEQQTDSAGRSKAVKYLQIAAVNPDTGGMANAWLRYAGHPVAPSQ